ncbi:MAG: TonB family protein [Crocinitomicaceae bacterium]|nr:TonB family protein [Crocinitomicaceae bacterium]
MKNTIQDHNSSVPSRLSMVLNARPSKKGALVFQAIITALIIHIFFLAVMYILTATPKMEQQEQEARVEVLDLEFAPPEEMENQQNSLPSTMSEEVRNLLANSQSQRTGERVNYSGKTQAEIEAEVLQNLKNLEQSEFENLKSTHKDLSVNEKKDDAKNAQDKKNVPKENDTDWYKNQSTKSYSGPVSAEYLLSGRQAKFTPRPTYRCKSSGTVVIKIVVDKSGAVTSAEIDEGKTSGNDCIREESLSYARRWKFDYKDDAEKKQDGTITFTFSAQ